MVLALYVRQACLNQLLISIGHLHLSGGWLGSNLRREHQKVMCLEEIGIQAQNLLLILSTIVIIVNREGGESDFRMAHCY